MRLLIVDDSNAIRSRISRVVQGGALTQVSLVGLARSGPEAVRVARATRPDVVAMDLTMPEIDAIGCIKEMQQILPDTRILLVGALSDKSTATQALGLGARGFVAKPFSDEELKVALMDVVDGKQG